MKQRIVDLLEDHKILPSGVDATLFADVVISYLCPDIDYTDELLFKIVSSLYSCEKICGNLDCYQQPYVKPILGYPVVAYSEEELEILNDLNSELSNLDDGLFL